MTEDAVRYKRSPSVHCRLIDLVNGDYDEDDRSIETVYGKIRRARIFGTLLYKKVSEPKDTEEEESMIKGPSLQKNNVSFLIDDGSSSLWINFWEVNPELYSKFIPGQLVQIVGNVKKNNMILNFYPDFISLVENPNFELLHELKMIKSLKKLGRKPTKKPILKQPEVNKEKENIGPTIKNEIPEAKSNNEQESKIDSEFEDDFDDFDDFDLSFDEAELEDAIIEIIRSSDSGDGVSFDEILSKTGGDRDTIENLINKLSLNLKIYSTKNNYYKINQ